MEDAQAALAALKLRLVERKDSKDSKLREVKLRSEHRQEASVILLGALHDEDEVAIQAASQSF